LLHEERAASAQRIAELEKERDNLRASHERLRQELELFMHRNSFGTQVAPASSKHAPSAP
jgi:hypothetical protein